MNIKLDGITEISGPLDQNRVRGKLSLPSDFPSGKFAVRWAKQGHGVATSREREQITGTRYAVDGWEVWHDKGNKPCIRSLSEGAYVLMVRPAVVQRNVSKICGNLSRERLKNEARGRTIAGAAVEDSGMLTDSILNQVERAGAEDANDALDTLSVNELSTEKARVSSRAKPIKSK